MMPLLGSHWVVPTRAFSAARVSGVLLLVWAIMFGAAIVLSEGQIVQTPGWQPLIMFLHGYQTIGGILISAGVIGFMGLAFERNDDRLWPRTLSVISCIIGGMWCGVATWAFVVAGVHGWLNSGPFMVAPGMILFLIRFWLLVDRPKPGEATLRG